MQLSDDDNDDDSREEYDENYDFVVDDDTIDGVKMINVSNNNEMLDIPGMFTCSIHKHYFYLLL